MSSVFVFILAPRNYTTASQFGYGTLPFAYKITNCFGWERNITECTASQQFNCSQIEAAAVTCRDGANISFNIIITIMFHDINKHFKHFKNVHVMVKLKSFSVSLVTENVTTQFKIIVLYNSCNHTNPVARYNDSKGHSHVTPDAAYNYTV